MEKQDSKIYRIFVAPRFKFNKNLYTKYALYGMFCDHTRLYKTCHFELRFVLSKLLKDQTSFVAITCPRVCVFWVSYLYV